MERSGWFISVFTLVLVRAKKRASCSLCSLFLAFLFHSPSFAYAQKALKWLNTEVRIYRKKERADILFLLFVGMQCK